MPQGKGELELHWGSTLFHIEDIPFESNFRDFPNTPYPFLDRVMPLCASPSSHHGCLLGRWCRDSIQIWPSGCETPSGTWFRAVCLSPPTARFGRPVCMSRHWRISPSLRATARRRTRRIHCPPFASRSSRLRPRSHVRRRVALEGGEKEGLARLRAYVWEKGGLDEFSRRRYDLFGSNFSSKLSPWLASGCLSPRRVWREIAVYENRRGPIKSTEEMKYILAYRDWTKFVAHKYGSMIFYRVSAFFSPSPSSGMQAGVIGNPISSRFRWKRNDAMVQRWKDGLTGVPFVDAAMRELKQTGYISNRSRMVAANFFATEMRTDWRLGAAHFETYLIDYDVCSNWVNWLVAANLLNEKNLYLNVVQQSTGLDPDGSYIRRWVSEVASLPDRWIHRPWEAPEEILEKCDVVLGKSYPEPIPGNYMR